MFLNFCYSFRIEVRGKSLSLEIDDDIKFCGHLRLQMAVEILVAVFCERRTDTIPIISAIWRTVPWPYISSAEMFDLLKPYNKGSDIELKDICEEYPARNTIFEVPRTPQPRSLKHLSRVQVRKNLCDAKSLSVDSIDSLHIPQTLKEYLKLAC